MTDPNEIPSPDPSAIGPLRERYPGARSFHDDSVDERLFFGRRKEIELLTHRIRATRLLLLFGKSGLGKTSLLQAGLFPKLRQEQAMLPVSIRFNRTDPPLQPGELVQLVIDRALEVARERGIDCEPGECNSLWEFFKTTDFWRGDTLLRPVLVLDQFEEVFTLQGAAFREALSGQLQDLVRRDLPDVVRRQRSDGNRPDYGTAPPQLGMVLSFREEYLAELEALVADVPSLLEHRFRLGPLTRDLAEEAIVEPAAISDGGLFHARPFVYDEKSTLPAILDFLSNEAGEVEPFQLQVLCSHIEHRVVERQSSSAEEAKITVDDCLLGGRKAMKAVLARFYEDALGRVRGRSQRGRARRLCQVGLLSPAGNRISAEESTIARGYKVKPDTLEQLIDTRLLRKDTRPGLKGFYYELSHDSLTEPVQAGLRRSRRRRAFLIVTPMLLVLTSGLLGWWQARLTVQEAEQAVKQVQTELKQTTRSVMELCERFSRTPPSARPWSQRGEGPEMLVISPGSACQGDISGAGSAAERPVRVVEFAYPFAIGRYEVTFEEYDEFAVATDRQLPSDEGWGRGRRPVINVTWWDAVDYAAWLSKKTGRSYRLPSESEWEYATRAGTITTRFWGNEDSLACRYANGFDAANAEALKIKYGFDWEPFPCEDEYARTAPVDAKEFQPNPLGLSQALGNVWEWTADCWHDNYEGAPSNGSAWAEPDGGDCFGRVLRGGSWVSKPRYVRSAYRNVSDADSGNLNIGFRLAQDLP